MVESVSVVVMVVETVVLVVVVVEMLLALNVGFE